MRPRGRDLKGSIADRPWGSVLGDLGVGGATSRLTLRAAEKVYRIEFDRGLVVAATSPLAVDSVVRVALAYHHITRVQLDRVKRSIATAPGLDELDVIAAVAHLTADQLLTLRKQIVAQCAARTFAVDEGTYEIEDTGPDTRDGVDVRSIIFMGAQQNLSAERMTTDLRRFGTRFRIDAGVLDELERFGMTKERALVEALVRCESLAELEARSRDIDPRAAQAVLYTLASCGALASLEEPVFDEPPLAQGTPGVTSLPDFEVEEASTTAFEGPLTRTISSLLDEQAAVVMVHDKPTAAVTRSMIDSFRTSKMTAVRPNALLRHEVVALIRERTEMIEDGVDHFRLLGVPLGAPIEDVHAAYVELQRNLDPKRLRELKISDDGLVAQHLLAQIAIAFTVLTDRIRRPEYLARLASLKRQRDTR